MPCPPVGLGQVGRLAHTAVSMRRAASLSVRSRQVTAVSEMCGWDLYAGQWRRHLRGRNLAASTVRGYLVSLGRLAAWATRRSATSPLQISQRDLESFLADRQTLPGPRGRATAATTAAIDARQLKVFFRWLAAVEEIGNPAVGLALPRMEERPVPLFTDAELRALLNVCAGRAFLDRRDKAIIRVLFDTGIRHAELAALDPMPLS
jgi:integrase/recombinase XerC